MTYDHKSIESKWQDLWEREGTFNPHSPLDSKNALLESKYILSMFPYPSGDIHMGHVRNYAISEAIARFYKREGFNVLHPMGFDAFGMPAENAAIKHSVHPKTWTYQNIAKMKDEFKQLGFTFPKERYFATSDGDYTKAEQNFFIDMWERGLIYRKEAMLNWCPNDETVLANEQIIDGKCWRCGEAVIQKRMNQYYVAITKYADELLDDLKKLKGKWPEPVLVMQENWIGKSSGVRVNYALDGLDGEIDIFTTRVDTIFGVSALVLSPEHDYVSKIFDSLTKASQEKIIAMRNLRPIDRQVAKKDGVFLDRNAICPLRGVKVPILVGSFVLSDYGSGAVMCTPAHDERDFEFANVMKLPINRVIDSKSELPDIKDGVLLDSGEFSGLESDIAREKIALVLESKNAGQREINYRLKDWGISRQRYWGAPIPLVHCKDCGIVSVKRENLPVELPESVSFEGGNPLLRNDSFMKTICPKCGQNALRESDTIDTFFESSWYFLRYVSDKSTWESAPIDRDGVDYWLKNGVDEYVGGIEHAILHLLYARFFTKMLRDFGYIKLNEPFANLLTQGMVLKDGAKMSKSKGNVVSPIQMQEEFGADAVRFFMLFAAPPQKEIEWKIEGIKGGYRFIKNFYENSLRARKIALLSELNLINLDSKDKLARLKVHSALVKNQEIYSKRTFALNSLIALCMEAFNALIQSSNVEVITEGYFILSNILESIIPHVCYEISDRLFARANLVALTPDLSALKSDKVTIAVSVNGKKRALIEVDSNISKEMALEFAKEEVQRFLTGEIKKEIFIPNKMINFVL